MCLLRQGNAFGAYKRTSRPLQLQTEFNSRTTLFSDLLPQALPFMNDAPSGMWSHALQDIATSAGCFTFHVSAAKVQKQRTWFHVHDFSLPHCRVQNDWQEIRMKTEIYTSHQIHLFGKPFSFRHKHKSSPFVFFQNIERSTSIRSNKHQEIEIKYLAIALTTRHPVTRKKLALSSSRSGSRSVFIVCLRIKGFRVF